MSASRAILITGADGYLGSMVARVLLDRSDDQLILWVRSSGTAEFERKTETLKANLKLRPDEEKRLCFKTGDLTSEGCFDAIDAGTVGSIVHSAAVTRFNVDAETAQSVNVQGTRRVIDFAKKCRGLARLCQVSSVYASGMRAGLVAEQPASEEYGFANHYEQSKWAAEQAIVHGGTDLPWSIVRVATIFADDASGHVTQHNAVHNTLKLLYYGLMSVVPGDTATPLYLITGDFAARAVAAVLNHRGDDGTVYHACYRRAECSTLGRFVDLAFETFEQDPGFKKRRILKPLYSDLQSFNVLSDAVTGFTDGITKQAVSSVSPFARQLFIDKDVENGNLRRVLADYEVPDAEQLVRLTCSYLCQTKWGRTEVAVNS